MYHKWCTNSVEESINRNVCGYAMVGIHKCA